MDVLYSLAQVLYDFIESSPGLLGILVYPFVVGFPLIGLHEIGHAVVAMRRLDTDVEVTVGNAAQVAEVRLGQISASLNILRTPGAPAGTASFDASRARAEDVLWIALAGPAFSAVALVLTILLYSAAPADGLVHDLLWTAVMVGLFGVLNVIPFRLGGEGKGQSASDGRMALDALRVIRELR